MEDAKISSTDKKMKVINTILPFNENKRGKSNKLII